MSDTTEFTVGQKIVYPSQGVGEIKEVFEKKSGDKVLSYYRIYIEVSDMIVMVPVANVKMLGIRPIVGADEAKKALESLGQDTGPVTSDWKLRYQMNLDLLKKGSIEDIASIVRCLYQRSKVKELPIQERKLYDSAKKLLEDEISFAMGITTKEAESMLHAKLEPLGLVREKKPIIDPNDEDDDDDFLDSGSSDKDDDDEDEDSADSADADESDDSDDDMDDED